MGSWVGGYQRLFVLRRLSDRRVADDTLPARLLERARACAGFSHPNLVPTSEPAVIDGLLYLVSEFIPGATLREISDAARATNLRLPAGLLRRVAREVAAGLHYAHSYVDPLGDSKPVVHGAFGDDSALVAYDGRVLVVDLAYPHEPGVRKSPFASPERLRGDPLDARADVFSLGAVLHSLLTGTRPQYAGLVEAASPLAALTPPSKVYAEASPALDACLFRALHPKPEGRFGTALELARGVERTTAWPLFSPSECGAVVEVLFEARREELRKLIARAEGDGATAVLKLPGLAPALLSEDPVRPTLRAPISDRLLMAELPTGPVLPAPAEEGPRTSPSFGAASRPDGSPGPSASEPDDGPNAPGELTAKVYPLGGDPTTGELALPAGLSGRGHPIPVSGAQGLAPPAPETSVPTRQQAVADVRRALELGGPPTGKVDLPRANGGLPAGAPPAIGSEPDFLSASQVHEVPPVLKPSPAFPPPLSQAAPPVGRPLAVGSEPDFATDSQVHEVPPVLASMPAAAPPALPPRLATTSLLFGSMPEVPKASPAQAVPPVLKPLPAESAPPSWLPSLGSGPLPVGSELDIVSASQAHELPPILEPAPEAVAPPLELEPPPLAEVPALASSPVLPQVPAEGASFASYSGLVSHTSKMDPTVGRRSVGLPLLAVAAFVVFGLATAWLADPELVRGWAEPLLTRAQGLIRPTSPSGPNVASGWQDAGPDASAPLATYGSGPAVGAAAQPGRDAGGAGEADGASGTADGGLDGGGAPDGGAADGGALDKGDGGEEGPEETEWPDLDLQVDAGARQDAGPAKLGKPVKPPAKVPKHRKRRR